MDDGYQVANGQDGELLVQHHHQATRFPAYRDSRTSVLYKTTTPDIDFTPMAPYHARELDDATEASINVTDAYAVLQAFHNAGLADAAYIDRTHFRPFLYEQLNDVLLNQLCA